MPTYEAPLSDEPPLTACRRAHDARHTPTWVHDDPAEVSAAAPRGIARVFVGLEAAGLVLYHDTEAYLMHAAGARGICYGPMA